MLFINVTVRYTEEKTRPCGPRRSMSVITLTRVLTVLHGMSERELMLELTKRSILAILTSLVNVS